MKDAASVILVFTAQIFFFASYVIGLAAYATSRNWIMFVIGLVAFPVGILNGILNIITYIF